MSILVVVLRPKGVPIVVGIPQCGGDSPTVVGIQWFSLQQTVMTACLIAAWLRVHSKSCDKIVTDPQGWWKAVRVD